MSTDPLSLIVVRPTQAATSFHHGATQSDIAAQLAHHTHEQQQRNASTVYRPGDIISLVSPSSSFSSSPIQVEVIECSPCALGGTATSDTTQWIVLPAGSRHPVEERDLRVKVGPAAEYRQERVRSGGSAASAGKAKKPLIVVGHLFQHAQQQQHEEEQQAPAPSAAHDAWNIVAVVNIDALAVMQGLPDTALAVELLRKMQHLRSSRGDRPDKFHPLSDLLVSSATLRKLELCHGSAVVVSSDDREASQRRRRLHLADQNDAEFQLLLDAVSSAVLVKQLERRRVERIRDRTYCVAFAAAECFVNTVSLRHSNGDDDECVVRLCRVRPAAADNNSPTCRPVAEAIVLRPLVRQTVTDSTAADAVSICLKASLDSVLFPAPPSSSSSFGNKPSRTTEIFRGDVLCIPRIPLLSSSSAADAASSLAPPPVSSPGSWEALHNPGLISTNAATNPASSLGAKIFCVVESVDVVDQATGSVIRDVVCSTALQGSTAISCGAPAATVTVHGIAGTTSSRTAGALPPLLPLNSMSLPSVHCPVSHEALFCSAAAQTAAFRDIHSAVNRVFGLPSSSTSRQLSSLQLLIVSAGTHTVGALYMLRASLSLVGLPFESCNPLLVPLEAVKKMAAHCASAFPGVLLLNCADEDIFEHSEVVQWLVSEGKRRAHNNNSISSSSMSNNPSLRVIMYTEAREPGTTVAILNTVSSWYVNFVGNESIADDNERSVFLSNLVGIARVLLCNAQAASSSSGTSILSRFIDFAALAEASAGLQFLELFEWFLSSLPAAANKSNGSLQSSQNSLVSLLDHDTLMSRLDVFKRQHGHNVTSTRLHEVRWADIGGLEQQRDEIMTVLQPPSYAAKSKRRVGVLLFGPPGCGKTLLAKAVATECGCNFLSVKGPELLNMYVGESEKNIREVFRKAREAAPCIIFFDELDALVPARGSKGDGSGSVMDRIVAQLLVELDGAANSVSGGSNDCCDDSASKSKSKSSSNSSSSVKKEKLVFIIGATNRPDLLDPSLLRPGRFDRMSYVGLAETKKDQLSAVKALTRKFKLADDIADLEKFLEMVPCVYTGADYYGLCADAMTVAVSESVAEFVRLQEEAAKKGGETAIVVEAPEPKIALRHFEQALKQLSPSVPPSELQKYAELRKQFAVGGTK